MKNDLSKLLKAVALKYNESMYAPILKAYGVGKKAKMIIDVAEKNNIPIREEEAEELFEIFSRMKGDIFSAIV